jgi:hypothetical protein
MTDFHDYKPVELLRDGRGIYGLGVSDAFDIEALAWACGVDHPIFYPSYPANLIFRPDLLDYPCERRCCAVLQQITGGFRHGMFTNCREELLRQTIHHEALNRAGLPWPPPDSLAIPYWSRDKKQQDHNRQIYHGLRRGSLRIINKLIGQAIEAAADPIALKNARRFGFKYRESIYRAGARSRRALQLTETFPVLALGIYCRDRFREDQPRSFGDYDNKEKERRARVQEAIALVERGARLRDIAAVMQVPMAMRHIKPGAAHIAGEIHKPEWIKSYMPDSLPDMRYWLRAVHYAGNKAGQDFANWTAKHALEIPASGAAAFLQNAADWVRASRPGCDAHHFIVRRFSSDMSLRTVTTLSAEWHEAVASRLDGPQHAFPPPWIAAAKFGRLDIVPIDNSADLYREGYFMRHCVGASAQEVMAGNYYVYSIRLDGKRIATAGLRKEGRPVLDQIRGPCNVEVPGEIKATVQRWLRSIKSQIADLPQ